jgi:hypothetical protein
MAQGDVKPFSRAGTDHLAYVLPNSKYDLCTVGKINCQSSTSYRNKMLSSSFDYTVINSGSQSTVYDWPWGRILDYLLEPN